MQLGKKENPIDQHFEGMLEQELFLKIRDDLLHSRTGIKLEENYIFAFHVLTDLMKAGDISDIKVLAWDNVRNEFGAKRKEALCEIQDWSRAL